MDIMALSPDELKTLQNRVASKLSKIERAEREQAIERCFAIAHALGLPIAALLPEGGAGKMRGARVARQLYRDPANPSNTWSGADPKPQWVKRALDAGVRLQLTD